MLRSIGKQSGEPMYTVSQKTGQGSVATRLGCGGVFVYDFVTNFLLSLTVKEF